MNPLAYLPFELQNVHETADTELFEKSPGHCRVSILEMLTVSKDPAVPLTDVRHVEEMRHPTPVTIPQVYTAYAEPLQRLKPRGVFVIMVGALLVSSYVIC